MGDTSKPPRSPPPRRMGAFLLPFLLLVCSSALQSTQSWLTKRLPTATGDSAARVLMQQAWHLEEQTGVSPGGTITKAKIRKIAIVGERHSGTNYMHELLANNFPSATVGDVFCNFKHSYQSPSGLCHPLEEMLVIIMLRNPYDWALSMNRYCWCGEIEHYKAMDLRSFLEAPFPENSRKPWLGELRRSESCGTVMQCRALKLRNFLNVSTWAPNVEVVRHEDVFTREQTRSWVKALAERYGLDLADGGSVQHIHQYKGTWSKSFDFEAAMRNSVWYNRALLDDPGTRAAVQAITRAMDMEVEAMAGYEPVVAD